MSQLVDVVAELKTLLPAMEGTTQGAAVKFAIQIIEESGSHTLRKKQAEALRWAASRIGGSPGSQAEVEWCATAIERGEVKFENKGE